MRRTYIWDRKLGKLVEKGQEAERNHGPTIIADIPDYTSPVSQYNPDVDGSPERYRGHLKNISGRAQRREDLKRAECHEVGPGDRHYMQKWKDRNHKDPAKIMGHKEEFHLDARKAMYQRQHRKG